MPGGRGQDVRLICSVSGYKEALMETQLRFSYIRLRVASNKHNSNMYQIIYHLNIMSLFLWQYHLSAPLSLRKFKVICTHVALYLGSLLIF